MRLGRVYITPSGLMVLLTAWWLDQEGVFPIFLLAAALHECAHILATVLLNRGGLSCASFRIDAFSAEITLGYMPPFREFICVLSGPAANLMAYFVICLPGPSSQWAAIFAGMNLLLGLYNLLPIVFLDGGRLLRLLLDRLCLGDNLAFAVSLATAAALTGLSLILCRFAGAGYGLFAASMVLLIKHLGCK